eukprot:1208731-Pyramimonas_sp.AAC.1
MADVERERLMKTKAANDLSKLTSMMRKFDEPVVKRKRITHKGSPIAKKGGHAGGGGKGESE